MSTILAFTSLDLNEQKKHELVEALKEACGQVFTHAMSIMFKQYPKEDCSEMAQDQITMFICVPPYMELDRKRKLIKVINDAVVAQVGYKGPMKVIVIFKYHADDAVGKDGELFLDIKAKKAAAEAAKQ